eukprot:2451651-Amphidinium_carterae.1
MFYGRYKRVPDPEERQLLGEILDSDRKLPDTWPPPANWRTALPPNVGTVVPVGPDGGAGDGSQVRPGGVSAGAVPEEEGFAKEESDDVEEEDGAPNWGE